MRLVAIIPARRGSKGLPGKNMRPLAKKPLVQHAIEAAQAAGQFDQVLVSSDDDAVLELAERLGAMPLRRALALASDTATMSDVIKDVYETSNAVGAPIGDAFALLQPTSPLRTARHVTECITQFKSGNYASAVSVCAVEHAPQKALTIVDGKLQPLFGWKDLQANRQSLAPAYRQNGAIWVVTWPSFCEHGRFVVAPAMPYMMDIVDSLDIDTRADFNFAEVAFAERARA
jgi:CMP-N,N'-diacetyllegionaminic acid synthase